MIKVEVIENFTLEDYRKLRNVKKVISRKENEFGARDTFECDEKMVDYLTGNNPLNKVVVKVIEVEPKKTEIVIDNINNQPIGELQPKVKEAIEYLENKKSTKKKKSSKK